VLPYHKGFAYSWYSFYVYGLGSFYMSMAKGIIYFQVYYKFVLTLVLKIGPIPIRIGKIGDSIKKKSNRLTKSDRPDLIPDFLEKIRFL